MKLAQAFPALALATLLLMPAASPAADARVYEMRTYYANPGKLDALHKRFRDHTLALFAKHGIESIGYWTPVDNADNKLVFLLAYPSRDAREKSWKAFMDDPAWKKAFEDSHKDGPLVARFESLFLQATDYSPVVKASKGDASRLFELRTYVAEAGRLDALNARFRDHTVKLFEKHGIQNVGYWVPMKDQPGGDNTLIYFIAHKDKAARDASFAAFGKDPDWQVARKASEEKAGGSLTVKGGVTYFFLNPTDYSKIR
jgi:hypothetical protein